jgi:hypothetical protein
MERGGKVIHSERLIFCEERNIVLEGGSNNDVLFFVEYCADVSEGFLRGL